MTTERAFVSETTGSLILPKARMMYASLFTPVFPSRKETDPKKKAWQITGLFPADVDMSAVDAAIAAVIEENLTPALQAKTKVKSPLLKTENIGSLAQYADDYPTMVRFNAKEFTNAGQRRQRPGVVKQDGVTDLMEDEEPDEIYNGRWFRASCRAFFWSDDQGGKGVSLGLNNIQLLSHDEALAGGKPKASADFEAVGEDDLGDLE